MIIPKFLRLRPSETLTVTIENGLVKLLFTNGTSVLNHRILVANAQYFKEGLVSTPAKVGQLIRQAVDEMGIKADQVLGVVPGFQNSIRLLVLPKARGIDPADFIPREAARTMGISLERSYLIWHRLPDFADRSLWVIASASRRSVAAYVETLREANLRTAEMDLRPFALARLVNEANTIICCLTTDGADAMIVNRHVPWVYHSLAWGSEVVEVEAAAERVSGLIEQAIASYDGLGLEAPLSEDVPINVVGSMLSETDPISTLSQYVRRQVVRLDTSPFSSTESFPVSDLAVNLGLALRRA